MNSTASLKDLIAAAEKINDFAAPFHLQHYSTGSKYFKFDRNAVFATVGAAVCDDEGGPIWEADYQCVGAPRLTVDIERFRHDKTPNEADRAESDIIDFCESLGFRVDFDSNIGSGQYGSISQLVLS